MAEQIATAAGTFEQRRTGHAPRSVAVILSGETLVITHHGALSPAEQALAQTTAGAARLREFHRQLFANSAEDLRNEIEQITGVQVRQAAAEIESAAGDLIHVSTTGTIVQVFFLARPVPSSEWRGTNTETHAPLIP